MSEVRLLMRLVFGLVILLVVQLDCLLPVGVVLLVLSHLLGLCRSQNTNLHSLYIHSFSIIDVLLFSLLVLGY